MAGAYVPSSEPDSGFQLTVLDRDPLWAAIRAVGRFDLAARHALVEIFEQLDDASRRIIRLDVSRVTFLDCSCLDQLVEAHHRLLDRHGLLVLTGVGASVARVLAITGLDDSLFVVQAHHDLPSSTLIARDPRDRRVSYQRRAAIANFDGLMAVADRLELP